MQWSNAKKGNKNPNFGKHHSEETKQKCREAALRQWQKIHAAQENTNVI